MKIIVAVLLLVLPGCTERVGLPEHFVVPDNYRGLFTVTVDPIRGISVPVTNGEFVFTIPADGKVCISSSKSLDGLHYLDATYASGQPLPHEYNPTNVSLRVIAGRLDKKTGRDTKRVVFLIGTKKEAEDAATKY